MLTAEDTFLLERNRRSIKASLYGQVTIFFFYMLA